MYEPGQKCVIIASGNGEGIGKVLEIKSTRTAVLSNSCCSTHAPFYGAQGLLCQEVFSSTIPEGKIIVWPISWMVPIDKNPDSKKIIEELEFSS